MKKEEKTELTKKRILAAAKKEFGENGYHGMTLNSICDAGIAKGLIYHNFENKDGIYLACLAQCFSNLTEYLRSHRETDEPQEYMDLRLRYFQDNPYDARLFFESLLQPPAHLKDRIKEIKTDYDSLTIELYKRLLSRITLRPDITQPQALVYFSLMLDMFNGYFSSLVFNGMDYSDMITAHEINFVKFLDYMFYGIAERRDEK